MRRTGYRSLKGMVMFAFLTTTEEELDHVRKTTDNAISVLYGLLALLEDMDTGKDEHEPRIAAISAVIEYVTWALEGQLSDLATLQDRIIDSNCDSK